MAWYELPFEFEGIAKTTLAYDEWAWLRRFSYGDGVSRPSRRARSARARSVRGSVDATIGDNVSPLTPCPGRTCGPIPASGSYRKPDAPAPDSASQAYPAHPRRPA
jgi:hypothetical protein